jgi:alanine dehydrogenase
MALLLGPDDVAACLNHQQVVDALQKGFRAEAEGRVKVPARITIPAQSGWLRVMPGVIDADGPAYMGCKIMNLIEGAGLRYMIVLFNSTTGDLLALMDAARITQMRTAATAALVARQLVNGACSTVGLLGSGFEARGLLEALSAELAFSDAIVYSRRREKREAFAREMSRRLGARVTAVGDPAEVLRRTSVVGLATTSAEPVIDGRWVAEGSTLLSIGSARPDQRELDDESLRRARRVVADSVSQVKTESGDIRAALETGVLNDEQIIPIADVVSGRIAAREQTEDIIVLKTVGTALQDLVVAGQVYESALQKGLGADLGDWPPIKPFA